MATLPIVIALGPLMGGGGGPNVALLNFGNSRKAHLTL